MMKTPEIYKPVGKEGPINPVCATCSAQKQLVNIPKHLTAESQIFVWGGDLYRTSADGQNVSDPLLWSVLYHSLVDSGVVLPLPGEAEHAADDSAVQLVPLAVTDLLPFAAILDLDVALRHRDPLPVRWQDGPNADVLDLNIKIL